MKVFALPRNHPDFYSIPEVTNKIVNFAARALLSATVIVPLAIGIYEVHYYHPKEQQLAPTKTWTELALRILSYVTLCRYFACGIREMWNDFPIELLKNCTRNELESFPPSKIFTVNEFTSLLSNTNIRCSTPLFNRIIQSPLLHAEEFPSIFSSFDHEQKTLFLSLLVKSESEVPAPLFRVILKEKENRSSVNKIVVTQIRKKPALIESELESLDSYHIDLIIEHVDINHPDGFILLILSKTNSGQRNNWLKRIANERQIILLDSLFFFLKVEDQRVILESLSDTKIPEFFLVKILNIRALAPQAKRFLDIRTKANPANAFNLVLVLYDPHPILLEGFREYLADKPDHRRYLFSKFGSSFFKDLTTTTFIIFFWEIEQTNFNCLSLVDNETMQRIVQTGLTWEMFNAFSPEQREIINFTNCSFERIFKRKSYREESDTLVIFTTRECKKCSLPEWSLGGYQEDTDQELQKLKNIAVETYGFSSYSLKRQVYEQAKRRYDERVRENNDARIKSESNIYKYVLTTNLINLLSPRQIYLYILHTLPVREASLTCLRCANTTKYNQVMEMFAPPKPQHSKPLLLEENVISALAKLGLTPNASKEEVKRRYRTLARKHHSDTGGEDATMAEINSAYDVLKAHYEIV